jgi:hypothetical protein
MTTSNFVNPTYYNLQKAIIRSEFGPTVAEVDITALIPSLSITSSMESETMYGVARVIDSVGLLSGTGRGDKEPLRAEEQIIFDIADSKTINENGGAEAGAVAEPYRFVGFIYKIDNVQTKEINDAVIYDIHFISYQSFRAGTYEIIRAFIDKPISEAANTIFTDYYASQETLSFIPEPQRKSLFLEPTDGIYRCTIPKMRAEEAMGFLSRRAYSVNSPSCMFRFFESSRGFHFITDEKLYRMASNTSEPGYDATRNFSFTYLDAIPDTLEYFEAQLNNLEVLENNKRVNSLDDLFSGAYRSKVYELDVLSRRLNLIDDTNQYDYFKERQKYLEVPKASQKLVDRHTQKFINTVNSPETSPQKKWLIVQNYTEGESSVTNAMQAETYYAEIVANRQAYSKHIESITVEASGPGRLDITAGDIVDLSVKEFEFANGGETGEFIENKYLSGKYIVKSVTHSMDREIMQNSYVLIKRDWSQTDNILFGGGR